MEDARRNNRAGPGRDVAPDRTAWPALDDELERHQRVVGLRPILALRCRFHSSRVRQRSFEPRLIMDIEPDKFPTVAAQLIDQILSPHPARAMDVRDLRGMVFPTDHYSSSSPFANEPQIGSDRVRGRPLRSAGTAGEWHRCGAEADNDRLVPTSESAQHQPLFPLWHRRLGAIASRYRGGIGLGLMAARLASDNDPHAGRCCAAERHRRASLGSHPPGVGLPWYGSSRFHGRCRRPLNRSPLPSFCE
jgi:hypothetical protein